MSALAPGFDPLIAEAKLRMRRRRVVLALFALLTGAAVLTLILRPSAPPGTTRVSPHRSTGSALAHVKVPVDGAERTWRAGIRAMNRNSQCACGLTVSGERRLDRKVTRVAGRTGATIVRMKIWPRFGEVELVLATAANPAFYLKHQLPPLVSALDRGDPYVKVVNSRGSSIFEWYYLAGQGMVGVPRRLQSCSPVANWGDPPPPCPAT
jgi:hypothetical protein